MKDDTKLPESDQRHSLSRREFTVLSVAAGVSAAASGTVFGATAEVAEYEVQIKTADGMCDAALVHPQGKGAWPGVIIFPDVLGASTDNAGYGEAPGRGGYTVIVPNPLSLGQSASVRGSFSFGNADDRAKAASCASL